MPAIRGAQLDSILDGSCAAPAKTLEITTDDKKTATIVNPEYERWIAKDQQLLSYILNSLTTGVLSQVATLTSSASVWAALEDMFSAQSRARVTNLYMQLVNCKKGDMKTPAYFAKMKMYGDELAAAGRPIGDQEMASFILNGLDIDYNPVVSSVLARTEPISLSELYAQIIAYDTRLDMLQDNYQSSANSASRGRGGYGHGRGGNRRRGRGGSGRGNGGRNNTGKQPSGNNSKPLCQICCKPNHEAAECWHRYDEAYQGQGSSKTAGSATTGYGVDTNWYVDSGASDHITGDLEKLSVRDKYHGQDQVHTANGSGMKISSIGHAILHTPGKDLHLQNILHVPSASKSLASIHRLTSDNNAFIEFHPNLFLIKDRATKKIIHQGRCKDGLYPLVQRSSGVKSQKQVFGVIKPSASRWHSRLGHPAFSIVERVIKSNNLQCVRDQNINIVCDSCLKAKSHQLPYSISNSISKAPLDLIYSDVWGPAPTSVGRYTYYVSFIDDYSKFTWIYLLRKKSDVFQVFHNFQNLVERKFSRKIISMQSDWGGEYEKLNSFFQKIGISHRVSCPHAHQQNGAAERKHRHIVEVGLALLANASMPLKFWDEAFLAAVYLINLLPSKVIDFETPTQRLLDETPNYNSLRVFGSACWPNLRPYNNRKLAFRSTRCVFLGYSPLHKGFKCLEPSTGRVYISRDVVFDEEVFPFESLHPNAGARLRKDILLLPDHLQNPEPGVENCTDSHASNTRATNDESQNFSGGDLVQVIEGTKVSQPHQDINDSGDPPATFTVRSETDQLGEPAAPSTISVDTGTPQRSLHGGGRFHSARLALALSNALCSSTYYSADTNRGRSDTNRGHIFCISVAS